MRNLSDPGQTISQQNEFLHEKYTVLKVGGRSKTSYVGTKTFLIDRKPGLFVNFGQFPCSWIRIHIPNTDTDPRQPYEWALAANTDPDPRTRQRYECGPFGSGSTTHIVCTRVQYVSV
jgi:hypothetical protein